MSGSFNVYKNKGQKQHSLLHMLKIQTHRVNTSRHAFIKCAQSVMQVQYFTRIGLSRSLAATQAIDSIGEGLETAHVSYTFVRRLERALREVANWLLIGL